jgi:hypothetical protein
MPMWNGRGQASFSTAAWAALGPLLPRKCGLSLADGDPQYDEAVVEVDGY